MPTTRFVKRASRRGASMVGFMIALSTLLSGAPADEKRIAIFSNAASYSLPVVDSNGREYAGLLEALEPLGPVSARSDSKHWRLRYNNSELEFNTDKNKVKMRGGDFDLGAPFEMQAGRGFVPITVLAPFLSRILGGPVAYNAASRRIFIGNIEVHFTAQVSGDASPLVMSFTSPVNPTIATSAGKLRMTFTHEPIVASGTPALTFNNKSITTAAYEEGNGNASITVNGTGPLFATFSADRKTITIAPAPSASTQTQPPVTPPSAAPSAPPTTREYFAVIDASHGGQDRGAALSAQLVEKDITLAFARRLQQEIESKGLPTLLLRNGDADITLDQRAGTTNAAHASIYICIHATSQLSGVNLYTALLPAASPARGVFVNWETAQAASLTRSQSAAEILAASFDSSKLSVRRLAAPLRPLNNVLTAAVAIEIGAPSSGSLRLDSSGYQQLIASTVAAGVITMRDKLGNAR